jgi:predicted DCC family thiol-disulfide oxidoreductase YuxK
MTSTAKPLFTGSNPVVASTFSPANFARGAQSRRELQRLCFRTMRLTSERLLTVLYDRDCGVCTATAKAVTRLDEGRRLDFIPAQTAQVEGAPSRSQLVARLYAVDDAGRWFSGAGAAVEIARRVPALWIVSATAHLPGAMVVYEIGYRVLAANRHRLSAMLGLPACQVPRRGPAVDRAA